MRFDASKLFLITLVMLFVLCGAASAASEQTETGTAAVQASLAKLPLSFIPNQGQADPAVLFQVKAEGYTIFMTQDNVFLASSGNGESRVFSTTLEGINPQAVITGTDPLPGNANFFIGDNPGSWQNDIPTYGGVNYANALNGIDLTYRGTNGVLKREFTVGPGADPSAIVIVYKGVNGISYGSDGTLQIDTPGGALEEAAPVCYQVIDGATVVVPAQYNILGANRVGFNIGSYNKDYPLVIDPALLYSSFLGGAINDAALGIAVDSLGCAYVTGYTESTNFPVNHSFNMSSNLCSDVFVTKVSPNGKYLLYSTYLGGNNTDVGRGIAVSSNGTAYVTGYTTSLNFPHPNGTEMNVNGTNPNPCPFPNCLGAADAFVAEISPDGLALPFATCIGGNATESGTGVAVSPDGTTIFITGFTNSDNFPVAGSGTGYQGVLNKGANPSASDAFVARLDGPVLPFTYVSYFGGENNDEGLGIAVNWSPNTPNVYITGWTQSTNLTVTPASAWPVYSGNEDAFATKFIFSGSSSTLDYSTYLGGYENDEGRGIAVANIAGTEYAHVTGVTYSSDFPIQDPFEPFGVANPYTPQFGDAFITKLNGDGSCNWSTYFGGNANDGANAIALDSLNNIYITGYTNSIDFPIVNPIPKFGVKHAFQDAFVTEINSNLTSVNFSTFLGASLDETGTGIAVTDPQNIYISGFTTSFDFPNSANYAGINSFKVLGKFDGSKYAGWIDGFVVHMNNVPTPSVPVANFTYELPAVIGCLPVTVNFTDTSTGNPTSWQWKFGDGSPNSTSPNPQHPYYIPGTYYPILTVSNSLGTSTVQKGPVVITPPPAPKWTDANSTTKIDSIHIPLNGTHKISLYLYATPRGLSGYNLTVSFRNSTVNTTPYVPDTVHVNITSVTRPEDIDQYVHIFEVSNISADSHNVTFQGEDLYGSPPFYAIVPGDVNVRLANITILGTQIGNSTLHINSTNLMTDDYGFNITLCPPDDNLTIYVENLTPLPGSIVPSPAPMTPKDPNGDGLYEDVNGDGVVNYYDVIDFFTWLWWITDNYTNSNVNEYQPFFDFDHNGVVNFYDVIKLYENIPPLV